MRKQTIQYTSPLDALVAVTKRLSIYENQQKMDSEEFFHQYNQGKLSGIVGCVRMKSVTHNYQGFGALRCR